jgi:hypothetical protein
MGWASAGQIFDPVALALIDSGVPDKAITRVCVVLIKQLQAGDWDTTGESWDACHHPAVREAFRQCDAAPECGEFHTPERGPTYWCALEDEHDGDHDDKDGHAWPKGAEG